MNHLFPSQSLFIRPFTLLQRNKLFPVCSRNFSTTTVSQYGNVTTKTREPPILHRSLPEPYGGGDIYWAIRRKLFNSAHSFLRLLHIRLMNTDVIRMLYSGIPKKSFNPKINQFYTYMDNEEWAGVGGRFWINVSNAILFPLYIAFWMYFLTYRIFYNNKHNVFARWANKDDEE